MTKKDFAAIIADKTGTTPKEAERFINAFDEIMIEEIFRKEDSVKFSFGTLCGVSKSSPEKTARNPFTGETITVPAKEYQGLPKLKISKTMKESCLQ